MNTIYLQGFHVGFDMAIGALLMPPNCNFHIDSEEMDAYASGYYDGYVSGCKAKNKPN